MIRAGLLVLALVGSLAMPAAAQDDPWSACRRAIAAAEPRSGLPPGLLLAIALVESGRANPRTGRVEPWPFALNVEGEGRLLPTRAAAIAEVASLRAAGRRSIDIGCMQVNLVHHPQAFPSVEAGFDPPTNVAYAVVFLRSLYARFGNWADATANYHSGDPERGAAYQRRVALASVGGAFMGRGGTIPLPRAALAGLCAAGRNPVLVVRPRQPRPRLACR